MTDPTLSTIALAFTLGLRHGLDPDHVAIIDNLTFAAAERRARTAAWSGFLFALGHSMSVAAVALAVASLMPRFVPSPALSSAFEWALIGLFFAVAYLNAAALSRRTPYTPAGWRQMMLPARLLGSSQALAPVGAGVLAGLMADTATQAAAWGAAAATGAVAGTLQVIGAFMLGMASVDTFDSQIVARLLRRAGDRSLTNAYRRGVGWLIVCLSCGMAAYMLALKLSGGEDMSPGAALAIGLAMALAVMAVLAAGELRVPDPVNSQKSP